MRPRTRNTRKAFAQVFSRLEIELLDKIDRLSQETLEDLGSGRSERLMP